jgi:putative Mg2+ transporter-C (MgtC) family protein
MPTNSELMVRVLVGFALAFVVGFEREVRGSSAGDRTFALVGLATTAITAVAITTSPQAVAGAVSGIGFIGAGVVFHSEGGLIRGITTAAGVFAVAAVGIVVGSGHLSLGALTAALVLLVLEVRNLPVLRLLDARRYAGRFTDDYHPVKARGSA